MKEFISKNILGFILVILFSFVVGIILNINGNFSSNVEKISEYHIYKYNEVSTSINENGELLILNKKTGKYTIYSDTVLIGIFNLKASQIKKDMEK